MSSWIHVVTQQASGGERTWHDIQVLLREMFPSAQMHFEESVGGREVDLGKPVEVFYALQQVQVVQSRYGEAPLLLERLTREMLSDIKALDRHTRTRHTALTTVLTGAVCSLPVGLAYIGGDPHRTWVWLHRALSAEVDEDEGSADHDRTLIAHALNDPQWHLLMATVLLKLAPALFYLAWRHKTAVELTAFLYPSLYQLCVENLLVHKLAIEAELQMLPWQLENDERSDAVTVARILERLLFDRPDSEYAASIAVLLSGQSPGLTLRSPADIAAWAMTHIHLQPEDAFALHLRVARGSANGWITAAFDDLRDELAGLLARVRAQGFDDVTESRVRGQIFSIFEPALFDLIHGGEHRRLYQWFGTWRMADPASIRQDACVAIAAGGDRAWFRPGTPVDANAFRQLAEFTAASNAALGTALVSEGQPDSQLRVPATGKKNSDHAGWFEQAVLNYLDVHDLAAYTRTQGAAAVVSLLPSHTPLQALLARAGGPVLPLCLSMQKPHPDREVSKVQFWCGDVHSAYQEFKILKEIFENVGIEIDLVSTEDVSRTRFLTDYESDTYDVIWVASHGIRPPYQPDEATIQLREGEELSLHDLQSVSCPSNGRRRLLVLNTCDSAASNNYSPFEEMGLGRGIVGPKQAVIGHLWRVDSSAALLLGALLAAGLSDRSPFTEAFGHALTILQAGWSDIAAELQSHGVGALAAEALHNFNAPTILDWGSAAFLE